MVKPSKLPYFTTTYICKNTQDNGYRYDALLSTDFIYGFSTIKEKQEWLAIATVRLYI